MKIEQLNKSKVPIIVFDKKLEQLRGKVLFPKKLKKVAKPQAIPKKQSKKKKLKILTGRADCRKID